MLDVERMLLLMTMMKYNWDKFSVLSFSVPTEEEKEDF